MRSRSASPAASRPRRGIYTAIIAGFLISALGGSRVQIGGPTGAFVVVVYAIVQRYGVSGLGIATLMAGVILILLGVFKLGAIIKFIPHPLVTGFTSGIAVIIASNEIRDFFGLAGDHDARGLHREAAAYCWSAIGTTNPCGGRDRAVHARAPRRVAPPRRSPAGPDRGARSSPRPSRRCSTCPWRPSAAAFGVIDLAIPSPRLPSVSIAELRALVGPAFTIAALGAIESLLSAMVADGMIGGRHRSNMELVAQGVANIASPLVRRYPRHGCDRADGHERQERRPHAVAGIVHALTLLVIALVFGKWAALIPMATLAGVLMLVAYQMSEWRLFRSELRGPRERRRGAA